MKSQKETTIWSYTRGELLLLYAMSWLSDTE